LAAVGERAWWPRPAEQLPGTRRHAVVELPRDGVSAGAGTKHPESVLRFDRWAATYDLSQLQTVLYGRVHDAVLRYARRRVPDPGAILDVGCGTGRLPARLVSAYGRAHVVGLDTSEGMIRKAATAPVLRRTGFAVSAAEQLPFADAIFDLVVATLSVSHWRDKATGLAQISRVMAPDALLVVADVCPARSFQPVTGWARPGRSRLPDELPALISASGLRVEHVEPIRSVASITDAALVAARTSRRRQRDPWRRIPGVSDRAWSAGVLVSSPSTPRHQPADPEGRPR
jgi:ubiquinone/menaquinone biosynthesis C-methylase UbiE